MIEVVSWPEDLSQWDPQKVPYYLELGGETSPILDTAYVGPAASDNKDAAVAAPIYEYWWTIGHAGFRPESSGRFGRLRGKASGYTMWQHLHEREKNVAARVYVFFPRSGGWRIKEVTAAVTYLTPSREQESLLDQAASDWSRIQPYVSGVSQLAAATAGTMAGGPIGGAAASGAAGRAVELLGTLAKVQLTSVPQTGNLAWAVAKMTTKSATYGVMQGVAWTLPKAVFDLLGGRITGTLSLSVIPAAVQTKGEVGTELSELEKLPALAHAVIYAADKNGASKSIWVPSQNQFVELHIRPGNPGSKAAIS